jgi:RsiW-degrading membrane proteinase PrsW (M82 family)
MGFAALETMGYGLVALLNSQGDISALSSVLLLRGIVSPVGHAAWTGIVCAILWRERQRGRPVSINILWAFVLAVILHSLWNMAGSADNTLLTLGGYVIIGAFSLWLLIKRWREAVRSATPEAPPDRS